MDLLLSCLETVAIDKQSPGPRIDHQSDRLSFDNRLYRKIRQLRFKTDCLFTCRNGTKDNLFPPVINRKAAAAQDVEASNSPQGNTQAPFHEAKILYDDSDGLSGQRTNLDTRQDEALSLNYSVQRLQRFRFAPQFQSVGQFLADGTRARASIEDHVHILDCSDGCFHDDQIAVVELERNLGLLPISASYISCCYISCCGRSRAGEGEGY